MSPDNWHLPALPETRIFALISTTAHYDREQLLDRALRVHLSVAIFDDRIDFTNPGHFPIGTSVEDFIETPRSKPQNPDIANVLFRSGWMESWGRGIANIMEG